MSKKISLKFSKKNKQYKKFKISKFSKGKKQLIFVMCIFFIIMICASIGTGQEI